MTLEFLDRAMKDSLKSGDKVRRLVLSEMIDAIKKASMTARGRIEITEDLVNETLQKVQKIYQEMVDTCPADRAAMKEQYEAQLEIVKEFAPQLITDEEYIRDLAYEQIVMTGLAMTKKNRGSIMRLVSPLFKGKADMKIVSKVIGEMLV